MTRMCRSHEGYVARVFLLISWSACTGPVDESLPSTLRAMTFNGGTTDGLAHDEGDDGYTSEHAAITDELYENSLSWNPAEQALTAFLAQTRPDVVALQEIYWDGWCAQIEVDPGLDFVCRDYDPAAPTQPQRLLGDDYQVACAPGQPDNCVGVHRDLGSIQGCSEALCQEGLDGMAPPDGCSNGARVGRVLIDLVDGGELSLVNVHGSSGLDSETRDCRLSQFRQVFEDRGDGQPAAVGEAIVLGDLNTDPFRMTEADPSAAYFAEQVDGQSWWFLSDETPSYGGLTAIDHAVSNVVKGSCKPGQIWDTVYWDHLPIVCEATW
jgi:hypothetical protein